MKRIRIRIVVVKKCARCGKKPRWGKNVYCKSCVKAVR